MRPDFAVLVAEELIRAIQQATTVIVGEELTKAMRYASAVVARDGLVDDVQPGPVLEVPAL